MTGRRGLDLRLYLVTDTGLCGARGVPATVTAAVRGGVTAVQVRDPEASTRALCGLARAVADVLAGTGVPLLVNDRADVARAVGAHGVHLGQQDLDPGAARDLLGQDAVVGLSVSGPADVTAAHRLPAGTVDYLGVGPVHRTATKPDAAPALGLAGTAEVAAGTTLPCVAIGGIHPRNVAEVRRTGVAGVAVVSAICAADDPARAARHLGGNR
jgi:thiamine-phosphate pyrophosphorylase